MADKHIGALPATSAVYDDTLFAAEQQGTAVKVTGKQIKSIVGGSGSGGGGSGGTSDGFVEMETPIPVENRVDNTLYGLILEEYGG